MCMGNDLPFHYTRICKKTQTLLIRTLHKPFLCSTLRLFETHPESKDVFFLFREIDDFQQLKMSKELQAHGLR